MATTYSILVNSRISNEGMLEWKSTTSFVGTRPIFTSDSKPVKEGVASEAIYKYVDNLSTSAGCLWGLGISLQDEATIPNGSTVKLHMEKSALEALFNWGQTKALGKLSTKVANIIRRRNLTVEFGNRVIDVHPMDNVAIIVRTETIRYDVCTASMVLRVKGQPANIELDSGVHHSEEEAELWGIWYALQQVDQLEDRPENIVLRVSGSQDLPGILVLGKRQSRDVETVAEDVLSYARMIGVTYLEVSTSGAYRLVGKSLV